MALKTFRKINRVYMVIKKFRERSKFRKADKLNSMHYNLINDLAFYKAIGEKNEFEEKIKKN